jgi:ElaB/YqjD/DUF883 family membrane-anchored ribosome-binding protein
MGQTADELRQEIDGKREDAAAKIDEIEARVQNTAQMAKETVEETMQTARDTVEDTIQTAKDTVTGTVTETVETVKQSFDVQRQIQERPLVALGAAALGGFLLGGAVGGGESKRHRADYSQSSNGGRTYNYQSYRSQPSPLQQAAKSAGLDNAMSAVTGALMGMAADRLRGIVDESFPNFGERLRREMNTSSGTTPGRYDASRTGSSAGTGMSESAYRRPIS